MRFLDNLDLERSRIKRWQLLLLFLIICCGIAYTVQLTQMSVFWDETVHLVGGFLIYQGKIGEYLTFTRYPPLVDFATAGYFTVFGVSIFSARLVGVTFSLLTIVSVFSFASKAYNHKVAFVSCVILATMPGFIVQSRINLLDIPSLFFFVAAMSLFVTWLKKGSNRYIIICGLLIGAAALAKYQAIIAALVIIASLPLLFYRNKFKAKISRFPLIFVSTTLVIVPMLVWIYSTGIFWQWIGLIQSSDTATNVYSQRFPLPVFYLLEMTVPFDYLHPIYLPIFILGMLGLILFVWRRKPEDRLLLVWFAVVYIFFTFVGTKHWRYVLPLFPLLAISSANFIVSLYNKLVSIWKSVQAPSNKKIFAKFLAGFLIIISTGMLIASTIEANNWISKDSAYVPLPESVHYIAERLGVNDSVIVVCAVNFVNQKATQFYLNAYESKTNKVLLYPMEPADVYTPNFNVTILIENCRVNNVKYIILFENKDEYYYNSTLMVGSIVYFMMNSGYIQYETGFGTQPYRIFIFKVSEL